MNKNIKDTLLIIVSFALGWISCGIFNKPSDNSYVKSLEQERIRLYLKLDSLAKENDGLDSIYYEYKKKEVARDLEYQSLKTQYNILKHENKNKNTPIKYFTITELDTFWTRQN